MLCSGKLHFFTFMSFYKHSLWMQGNNPIQKEHLESLKKLKGQVILRLACVCVCVCLQDGLQLVSSHLDGSFHTLWTSFVSNLDPLGIRWDINQLMLIKFFFFPAKTVAVWEEKSYRFHLIFCVVFFSFSKKKNWGRQRWRFSWVWGVKESQMHLLNLC